MGNKSEFNESFEDDRLQPFIHEGFSSDDVQVSNKALSAYERDLEKILHSKAYARYFDKTQVVYLVSFDHITRRGLHVQFVSNFSRSIGKRIGLNLDLIECIALGHDVGHPPFGHEGEVYLSNISQEQGLGSFSHSSQSCRLFEMIEPLDLSFEVLDGFLCHDGGMRTRITKPCLNKERNQFDAEIELRKLTPEADLIPATWEALLVKICDTVSYLGRDIEDGIALGLIARNEVPWGEFKPSNASVLNVVRNDILATYHETGFLGFSEAIFDRLKMIRKFNFERIYWHPKLKTESSKIELVYRWLFDSLFTEWKQRGDDSLLWRSYLHSRSKMYLDSTQDAGYVIDFMAGMTDRYFLELAKERIIPQKIDIDRENLCIRSL